jgi:hypothetical protein
MGHALSTPVPIRTFDPKDSYCTSLTFPFKNVTFKSL